MPFFKSKSNVYEYNNNNLDFNISPCYQYNILIDYTNQSAYDDSYYSKMTLRNLDGKYNINLIKPRKLGIFTTKYNCALLCL